MSTKSPHNDSAGRNRKVTKFALAGLAVLGVGAALTSAAWTDNVFFAASATSGSIDLEGSSDGGATWADGSSAGTAILVDPAVFNDMAPLESRVVTLMVRNNGQGNLNLVAPSAASSFGDFFDGGANDFTSVSFGAYSDSVLSPTETASFTVTLVAPNWTNADQNNNSSVLVVDVQAAT